MSPDCTHGKSGGEGGIRTPGTGFSQYNGLANRRIQPLCHLSAAKFVQHCNLEPHLVTVPPSIAAFWCTLSPKCHATSFEIRVRPAHTRAHPCLRLSLLNMFSNVQHTCVDVTFGLVP